MQAKNLLIPSIRTLLVIAGSLFALHACTFFKTHKQEKTKVATQANPDLELFLISEKTSAQKKYKSEFFNFISGLYPAVPQGFQHREHNSLETVELLSNNRTGSTQQIVLAIEVEQLTESHSKTIKAKLNKLAARPSKKALIFYLNYCTSSPEAVEALSQVFTEASKSFGSSQVEHFLTAGASCQPIDYIDMMMHMTWYEKLAHEFLWLDFDPKLLKQGLQNTPCSTGQDKRFLSRGSVHPTASLFSFITGSSIVPNGAQESSPLIPFENEFTVRDCTL